MTHDNASTSLPDHWFSAFWEADGNVSMKPSGALNINVVQRADRQAVLQRFKTRFGGTISPRTIQARVSKKWGKIAAWQLQDRRSQFEFLRAIAPLVVIKGEAVEIALEALTGWVSGGWVRDDLGRYRGRRVTPEERQRRAQLRYRLQLANRVGPEAGRPVQLPLLIELADPTLLQRVDPILSVDPDAHWSHALDKETAQSILDEYGDEENPNKPTMQALADRYGIHKRTVLRLIHNETYRRTLGITEPNTRDYRDRSREAAKRQKGPRTVAGTTSPLAKLSPEQVREVIRRYDVPIAVRPSHRALAAEFGVSKPIIANILKGKSYRGITGDTMTGRDYSDGRKPRPKQTTDSPEPVAHFDSTGKRVW